MSISPAGSVPSPAPFRKARISGPQIVMRRGLLGCLAVLLFWEFAARAPQIFGVQVPVIGALPAPSAVVIAWAGLVSHADYWWSWYLSSVRVAAGFACACLIGIPLGLALGTSRLLYGIIFPVFEVLRPIPPIAWVPAAIIFWPTQELSIGFVIFLGAFYTITLGTLGAAREVEPALVHAALSMGASRWRVFRRIILPATIPSISTSAAVGMGITWEVVVAAEIISGSGGGQTGGGLGHLIWNAYIAGDREIIIVGMISIGIAGYASSTLLRKLGTMATPWIEGRK